MLKTSSRSPVRFSLFLTFCALAGCGGKVAGLGDRGADGDSGGVPVPVGSSSGGYVGGSSSGGVVPGGSSGSSSGGSVRDGGATRVDASPSSSGSSSGGGSGSSSGFVEDASTQDATLGVVDASTQDATIGVVDAGGANNCGLGSVGATCSPQPLGACVPGYVPPVHAKGSCTAADVQAFYQDCLSSGANCTGSDLSSKACLDCLSTSANGPDWGVIVFYGPPTGGNFSISPFACMAQIGASTECVAAAEEQDECETAACQKTCESANATDQAFIDCYTAADNGECASYVAAASALCPASIVNSPACGGTLADDAGTGFPLAYYQAVAQTVCE